MLIQVIDEDEFQDILESAISAVQQGLYFRDTNGDYVVFCGGYNAVFEYWEFEELMPD